MAISFLLVSLIERLSQPNVIVGIILAALGIAVAVLARRIACAARKTSNVPNDDSIMIATKVIGLVFIVIALIVMIVK